MSVIFADKTAVNLFVKKKQSKNHVQCVSRGKKLSLIFFCKNLMMLFVASFNFIQTVFWEKEISTFNLEPRGGKRRQKSIIEHHFNPLRHDFGGFYGPLSHHPSLL